MTYDIHPIVVHFPIALLFLYSLLVIFPFQKWFPKVSWRDIQRILLIVGVAGASVALITGDIAEELNRPNRQVVEAHSTFAAIATWLYGILLLGELVAFVNTRFSLQLEKYISIKKPLSVLERVLTKRSISIILSILALISITLTGILGGVLVYGTSADPLAGIVLKMLGISF